MTAAPDARLSPNVRSLVDALRRNGPRLSWSVQQHREVFEEAVRHRELHTDVRIIAGSGPDGAIEWHHPTDRRDDMTIMYLHGGGYIMGSLATTRPIASHLAAATGRSVMVLEYDLAPESRYPRQIEQTVRTYDWLRRSADGPIVLAGDSAGASLCLATAQRRSQPEERAIGLLLLSPLLDLRLIARSVDRNESFDPQTPRWLLELMARQYLGDQPAEDPGPSPLLGHLNSLPPVLVQAAELETLVDDAVSFGAAASAAGTDVDLQIWPGMIHVWHAFAPRLPEASQALASVRTWMDSL